MFFVKVRPWIFEKVWNYDQSTTLFLEGYIMWKHISCQSVCDIKCLWYNVNIYIYIYISIMPKCLWYKVFVIYWKTYISCQSVCNIVHMPSCCDVIPCGLMWCFFNPWWPGDILRDPERPWGTLRNRVRDLRDLEESWETVWTNLKPCEGTWETVVEKELEKPWENLRDCEGIGRTVHEGP